MRYGITILTLGPPNWIDISHADFCSIKAAKHKIAAVVGIEEKLDLVLENYIEYEHELQGLALQSMVFQDISWRSMRHDINRINRRVVNLLSATRLYLDQVRHDLSDLSDISSGKILIDKAISAEYDNRFSYRFIDSLRNNVQHRVMPIHGITYKSSWIGESDPREMVVRVVPCLTVARLLADFKFKSAVQDEIRECARDSLNLTPLIREYVEALCRVHEVFRNVLAAEVSHWESTLKGAIKQARERWGDESKLFVIVAEEDQRHLESEPLISEMLDHHDSLVRKNRSFNNLSRRYVSTSCSEER